MQDHVAGITEYVNLAIRILQQPVATTGVVKSPQYPIRQIYWNDVPVSELKRMSFHTTNTIQQNTHHAQSLLQCLVIALQGSVLAGFTYSHMDLFRLTNNDNLGERLIFNELVGIISGKWPDFLEKSPDYIDRDTWLEL